MTAGGRGGRAVCFSRPQARPGAASEGRSERQTLADRRLRHPAVHPAFSLPLLRCLVALAAVVPALVLVTERLSPEHAAFPVRRPATR